MENAVNQRRDAVDKRHLGTLLQMAALRCLYAETTHMQLVSLLFQQVVKLTVLFLTLVQPVGTG